MVIKVDTQKFFDAKKTSAEALRKEAYQNEADPLFFKVQRGEATLEEWQTKIAEIKARFPYPTV